MMTTARSVRKTENRTLHFDLSHCPKDAHHTLHLGFDRHELVPHDKTSRDHHRQRTKLLGHVPDSRLTHYLTVDLPSEAVQSYWITHESKRHELPQMSLAGIHVPKAVVRDHHSKYGVTRSIHQAKARQLGLIPEVGAGGDKPALPDWVDNGDLADFTDFTEAAKFIVFHHPEMLCFEPSTVVEVLAKIESTHSFHQLVQTMMNAGNVVGPDKAEEGWTGWATAEYTLDPDGHKIPVTDCSKPLDQQPPNLGYTWSYDYDPTVKEAMKPVVKEALRLMRNDPTLEGVSFQTTYGIHAFDESAVLKSSSTSPQPARVRRFAMRPSLTSASGYKFEIDDPGWGNGLQVEVVSTRGRQVTLRVNNSFFLYRSIYVRFLDQDRNKIALADIDKAQRPPNTFESADTKFDSFQAIAKPRQRIMGIPVEASSSREFTVTIPDSASYMEVVVGSASMHDYVPASYEGVEKPSLLQTYLLCYGLPGFLLALGIGTAIFTHRPFVVMLEQVASDIVEAAMTPALQHLMHSGQTPAEIGAAFWAMAPRLPASLAASIATTMVFLYTEFGTKYGPLTMFPAIKAAFIAVATVAVLAEMVETTINLSETPKVARRTVSALIPVQVRVAHDPDDYQFPEGALHYKITATQGSGPSSIFEGDLETPKVDAIEHVFTVTSGGHIVVEAQFTDPETGWVGGYGKSEPIPNVLPQGKDSLNVSLQIKENLIPLTQHTSYRHVEKLSYSNGKHVWTKTGQPPQSTIHSLGGNMAVSLADLDDITINMKGRLGYVWKGISPKLIPADTPGKSDGSTPLHTLQTISLDGSDPDQFLRILGSSSGQQVGFTRPIFLQYDFLGPVDGLHFVVSPRQVNGVWHYHAHRISLGERGPIDLSYAPSWGCFASQRIRDIAVHPRGVLVALNADEEKVELLNIPDTPATDLSRAVPASQLAGLGSYKGLLHGAKALSLTLDGNTFLVLEEVNSRIQAFSVTNASVTYFDGAEYIRLNQGQDTPNTKVTYLDMSLEYGGYIYVLSYTGSGDKWQDYRMDLYEPNGKFLTRVQGVPAAKLVVDKWRVVYTENFELMEGPQQRPEPTVSAWAAHAA